MLARAFSASAEPARAGDRGPRPLEGEDLLHAAPERMRAIRGSAIAMIFQEPMTALNPLMTIGRQVDEVIRTHARLSAAERRTRIVAMFEDVRPPTPSRDHPLLPA